MPYTRTTLGKILINDAIPENMRDSERVFDKKEVSSFFDRLATEHPEKYIDVLQNMSNISRSAATYYGGIASLKLKDLRIPPKTKEYRDILSNKVRQISQDSSISSEEKNKRIVDLMKKAMPTIQKTLINEITSRDNSYGEQIANGIRGNPSQVAQLIFGDMLLADQNGRAIPIPGLHGYGEGVTGPEFWAGTYASRKGYSDVQFATANTGYLGKQLSGMAQNIVITGEDCGAKGVGILVDPSDPEIIGSVLAKAADNMEAGKSIGPKDMGKFSSNKKILVRSLLTCQMDEGVCQKCAGRRDQNDYPAIGSYIGIEAARVLSEPMTQQLALSAKHLGGVVGVNDDNLSGFDEIDQFVQIPKYFKGGAVLSKEEGKITKIIEAPQGGNYVYVNNTQEYIPSSREVLVKVGDPVEKGDTLSDGTPNPYDIAMLKGLGEGRRYFQDTFYNMLSKNGVPSHRRNVEVLSKSFFDKVQITDPDGVMGYEISQVVPYSEFQKYYKPRKDSFDDKPKRSLGKYLESPVLHYSIGTKVTPRVIETLEDQGIEKIKVNEKSPGFEPYVVRAMSVLGSDPDWKVRMSGFGLKKSFLESARVGAHSKNEGVSYIPNVMDPGRL